MSYKIQLFKNRGNVLIQFKTNLLIENFPFKLKVLNYNGDLSNYEKMKNFLKMNLNEFEKSNDLRILQFNEKLFKKESNDLNEHDEL